MLRLSLYMQKLWYNQSMDEIILIDKPAGMTSFGVVARVRRVLSEQAGRRIKVGHAGTLDPFATGLLILGAGKATKRMQEFLKLDKVYEATLHLGATSTTGDPEGEIITTQNANLKGLTLKKVESTIGEFLGDIEQVPPIYSAIKVNGQRAYKLARKGEKPSIPPRKVHIHSLEILDYDYPVLRLRAHVSSGTYIRTLAEDIGQKLGTGVYLTALRRTKIGNYSVEDATKLDDFMSERC